MSLVPAPRRLLVVDDELPIRFALSGYFSAHGFEVDTARDLDEARALLGAHHYALVITDLRMSGTMGTEGIELVTLLRARSPEVRIVLLTGYGSPEVELEAHRKGVDVFLEKPIPLARIAAIAAQLLAGEAGR
jgi:DNA-binding NtrC family response regulator